MLTKMSIHQHTAASEIFFKLQHFECGLNAVMPNESPDNLCWMQFQETFTPFFWTLVAELN
jgi:hypothetical protein